MGLPARLVVYPDENHWILKPQNARLWYETVLAFLDDLARHARPFAEKDVAELRTFAQEELKIQALEAWDVAYASEKLRAERYSFSDQEVKQYFPEDAVLAGLFGLVEALYGVRIRPGAAAAYHPTVRFFEISGPDGARVAAHRLGLGVVHALSFGGRGSK